MAPGRRVHAKPHEPSEQTRIADQPRLVIDSALRLERAALRNSAEKLSALEVLSKAGKDDLSQGMCEPVPGRKVRSAEDIQRENQPGSDWS